MPAQALIFSVVKNLDVPRLMRGLPRLTFFLVFAIGILIDEWQADNYAFGAP